MNVNVQRSFILGDQWLYYKIYSGAKTSDLIITEVIKPVSESLMKENIIDKWFFIRYTDPKHHLRVRFHYQNQEDVGKIINCLQPYFSEYIDKDIVWKIQTDTYSRELERYGTNTMELSEILFFHDSEAIANFLSLIDGDEGEKLRWLFVLRMIDTLLGCFAYNEENKLSLLEHLKKVFGIEFGINKFLKKQIDAKYRDSRKDIEEFMIFDEKQIPDYEPVLEILKTYRDTIMPIAEEILQLKTQDKLQVNLNDLMSSYIHMTMNRLFKSKNRLHELVCYDFLFRYYKSYVARKNVIKYV